MAGIWDRIDPDADDRLDMHLIHWAVTLFLEGDFTAAQILSGLNSKLDSPLAGDEITELNALATWVNTPAAVIDKVRRCGRLEAFLGVVENGLMNETTFRSKVGL